MWQRGRMLKRKNFDDHGTAGKTVWIKDKPYMPEVRWHDTVNGESSQIVDYLIYDTNIHDGKDILSVPASQIELLSRDLDDFADDVPIIRWEDFIK